MRVRCVYSTCITLYSNTKEGVGFPLRVLRFQVELELAVKYTIAFIKKHNAGTYIM